VEQAASALPPEAWAELLELSLDDADERALLERVIDLWRTTHRVASAALYIDKGDLLEQAATSGSPALPPVLEDPSRLTHLGWVRMSTGGLLFAPAEDGSPRPLVQTLSGHPLTLFAAAALKASRLRQELKEQQFQGNFRVVELESLYDVGLAIAATLDREQLAEEILLRAVSLLDARRGALYFNESGSYRLDRTFGGDAAPTVRVDSPALGAFLAGAAPPPPDLLPEARHVLAVPIAVEASARGLIVVGDKESRRGVGPFPPANRRTLELFANQAAIALENARLHLDALEKERLDREMSLASEIQRQILPHGAPTVAGFEMLGWNRPARQVGGDYYDLVVRESGNVSLVVGDVSGKGMPAALMVSTLHSALRLLTDQAGTGPELLSRLNRHVLDSSASNKFITLLIAELNPTSGELLFLNAGHNPGLLLRHTGEVVELQSTGLPIGLLAGSRFEARSLAFERGDLLCLYTDGITECESPEEEEFGKQRLIDRLQENREQSLSAILEVIKQQMAQFSEGLPQGDDQTVVLVRRDLPA
jgi:sigma-B regulation protein RsbU (phosphoserine phosphatase)